MSAPHAAAAALLLVAALTAPVTPTAQAICGSIGGRHVDVSGCSDPLSELQDVLPPPPPPPGAPPPPVSAPPPPPPPDVQVCGSLGRRITVSGCV